jgi:hypothetical protein
MSTYKKLLFSGNPPLKYSTAKSIQEMIEKALGVNFTDEQIKLFQKRLVLEWQEGKKARREINKSEKTAEDVESQIQALPIEKQAYAWREFGRQIYIYAENEGKDDPIGQLILDLYQRKNLLLIKGNPPLSRQAAESYAEMTVFINNVINNTLVSLEANQKEDLIDELIKNYPSYSLEQKENISQSDALWGQLRYNWKVASDEEKENFKKEIESYLPKETPKLLEPKVESILPSEVDKVQALEKEVEEVKKEVEEVKEGVEEVKEPSSILKKAIKMLPPKFLDTVAQLRAKANKVALISRKPE